MESLELGLCAECADNSPLKAIKSKNPLQNRNDPQFGIALKDYSSFSSTDLKSKRFAFLRNLTSSSLYYL